jgi:hypothetical protein
MAKKVSYPGHSKALMFIAAVCFFIAAMVDIGFWTGIGPFLAWVAGGLSAWALSGVL